MGEITLVAAMAKGRVLGKDGQLPWHVPEDLAFFKTLTTGGTVVMGRKTWDGLPRKPLPKRQNIVLSRDGQPRDGAKTRTLEDVLVQNTHHDTPLFVIGGGEIYQAFLPHASKIWLTEMDIDVEGDTLFPELGTEWTVQTRQTLKEKNPRAVASLWMRTPFFGQVT